MRNTTLAALGTLALLASASAFGQQIVRADVPFEFSIANKVMPPGQYDVTRKAGLLLVRCYSTRAATFTPVNNLGGGPDENAPSRLTFNKYGDKYFLTEVWWSPRSGYGAGLPTSKTEREIARVTQQVARISIPAGAGVATLAALR